jgi:transposase, IS30 family
MKPSSSAATRRDASDGKASHEMSGWAQSVIATTEVSRGWLVRKVPRWGPGVGVPWEVKREIILLVRAGGSWPSTAERFGVTVRTVARVMRDSGGMPSRRVRRSPLRLSLDERELIMVGLRERRSFAAIARELGRPTSAVSREVNGHGGRDGYRAAAADRAAEVSSRRPRATVFETRPRLREYVEAKLELRWAPEQIADRLVHDFPDDEEMRVSHETIYQALFVQSRGGLRKELVKQLRSGRVRRRPLSRSASARRGKIVGMTMISDRPAEIEDRAVPGHWEGDLIKGKNNGSAIGTLVERSFRFTMLLKLDSVTTDEVVEAIQRQIAQLPEQLRRSLTWDQGTELAGHARFSVATGIPVYFCDPHSPWQRGTNENTNGLLRQYFPKGTDLSVYSQADLDAVAAELNGRPRRVLKSLTPSEAFNNFVALTT